MSLGLGQLLESAKTFRNTNFGHSFNPMFASIKKSFQSILGSANGQDAATMEESKSKPQLVLMDDFNSTNGADSRKNLLLSPETNERPSLDKVSPSIKVPLPYAQIDLRVAEEGDSG